MRFLIIFLLFVSQFVYAAEIKEYFDKIEADRKGPFGPNMMQRQKDRVSFNNWNGSGYIFQAAFRNDVANQLIDEHGIYTGNLFATNYYELRAEFLLNDRFASNLSDNDNIELLITVANLNQDVLSRAKQMAQNWVIEKYYTLKNPSTKLSRSFAYRGVSGAEFEQAYAREFVNFYTSMVKNNVSLIPLIRLAEVSPLIESSTFTKIRDRATEMFESYKDVVTANQKNWLQKIRNSIHNQLTTDVTKDIQAYINANPKNIANDSLANIKQLILVYFDRGVDDIVFIAKQDKIDTSNVTKLNVKTPILEDMASLASELKTMRDQTLTTSVSLDKKYIHLVYTLVTSSFLSEKLRNYIENNKINSSNIGIVTEAITKVLFVQGLISDSEIAKAKQVPTDFDNYEVYYDELLTVCLENVKTSYDPYLKKWEEVDEHISALVDDSIRSSAMGLFNHILDEME